MVFRLFFSQVSILERRNTAGRVVYKTLEDPWTGSESDKFILLGYLDQLRKDPALLSSEAVLPDLTDELAPVSTRPRRVGAGQGSQAVRAAVPCQGWGASPSGAQGPVLTPFLLPQIFLLRWLYSASDYISDCWDSIFHNNW